MDDLRLLLAKANGSSMHSHDDGLQDLPIEFIERFELEIFQWWIGFQMVPDRQAFQMGWEIERRATPTPLHDSADARIEQGKPGLRGMGFEACIRIPEAIPKNVSYRFIGYANAVPSGGDILRSGHQAKRAGAEKNGIMTTNPFDTAIQDRKMGRSGYTRGAIYVAENTISHPGVNDTSYTQDRISAIIHPRSMMNESILPATLKADALDSDLRKRP